jgi:hypothetical protein
MATSQIHSQIPLPAPLNINSNLLVDWKRFKGQWVNYVKAAKLNVEPKDRQAAILLACIGSNAYTVYTTFQFENKDDCDDPEKLCQAFERYCVGELNVVYERYVFNRRQQEPGETFDSFVGDLRQLVKSCEYATVEDSIVRDRIVLGIRDDVTRRKLLQARTLDLKSAIDICRQGRPSPPKAMTHTSPPPNSRFFHVPALPFPLFSCPSFPIPSFPSPPPPFLFPVLPSPPLIPFSCAFLGYGGIAPGKFLLGYFTDARR